MFQIETTLPELPAGAENPAEELAKQIENPGSAFKALEGLSFDEAIGKIIDSLVHFAFTLVIAVLVFYIGRFIIRKLYQWSLNVMTRRQLDASLTTFTLSLIKMVLYFILIVTVIGILGIETSSFLAIFASAGVAVGLALSGTLQNFAGGVLILLLKPYKVGDYIEAQGYAGTVKAIQIFYTVINTVDNRAIIIPNGGLSTGTINNFSFESYRRVDWTIGLTYGTDYEAVKDCILDIVKSDDRIVEKYIEDDQVKRARQFLEMAEEKSQAELEAKEESERGFCYAEKGKPLPWWKRIFCRKKSEQQLLEEKLRSKIKIANQNVMQEKKDCTPFVGLNELADSSINIVVRAWVHSSLYWPVYFDMNKRFYTELPQKGFEFPFPQLDVHFDKP